MCEETSNSLREAHEEASVSPDPPARRNTKPAPLFNQKDLTEELWGLWQKDKETPHSRRDRSPYALRVFMLLCLCNSLSSWMETKPAGFPGSSNWLGWRGMQWMQPLGLAAEQRVFRELMLQQWESDYKVLALHCRLNTGCLNKENTPNEGTGTAAPLICMRNSVGA